MLQSTSATRVEKISSASPARGRQTRSRTCRHDGRAHEPIADRLVRAHAQAGSVEGPRGPAPQRRRWLRRLRTISYSPIHREWRTTLHPACLVPGRAGGHRPGKRTRSPRQAAHVANDQDPTQHILNNELIQFNWADSEPNHMLLRSFLCASGLTALTVLGGHVAAAPDSLSAGLEADRSIVAVDASIVISRPPAEVFDFVANAENDVLWRSEVISMKNTTPPPAGVGTQTIEVAKVLGKRLETTTEIIEFVPGRKTARRTLSGETPVRTERTVVAVEGGAQFTYKLRADVTDVLAFRLLRPLLQWWTQRKVRGYLEQLKLVLEAPVPAATKAP